MSFTITYEGQTRTYEEPVKCRRALRDFLGQDDYSIVLVKINGKLQELFRKISGDCTMEPVTTSTKIGHTTYVRSLIFLLSKAVRTAFKENPGCHSVCHFSMGPGLYFTLEGMDDPITQVRLDKIKAEMNRLIEENKSFGKNTVSTKKAISIFHSQGMEEKEILFRYRRASNTNMYKMGEYQDYSYGYMVPKPEYLRLFDLKLYDDGFILLSPTASNPGVLPELVINPKIFRVQKYSKFWGRRVGVPYVGNLNDAICSGDISRFILTCEALHESNISHIADEIMKRPEVKFVMIAGPSSSGKTSFSHRLSVQLSARGVKPHPIAMDDYYVNREDTPLDEFGEKDYECLEAVDIETFNRDMLSLLRGEKVELPEYNFIKGEREYKGKYLQLGHDDILVIEGIHGLNDKMSYALPKESKFKIYISALTQLNVDANNRIPTTDGRLLRRMIRDARTRGTSARETLNRWPSVRRGEEKYIFPFQEEADAMFNSALPYEVACIKVYAEPLLYSIDQDDPAYQEAKRMLKFLDYFLPIPVNSIPQNSLLREFVGGSIFPVG